jgi:hypothetical protein
MMSSRFLMFTLSLLQTQTLHFTLRTPHNHSSDHDALSTLEETTIAPLHRETISFDHNSYPT